MAEQRVSIAMATFNGEKYLPAQLDSFLAQSRLPHEVVIGDDGSRDATLAIVEAFAAQAPFPVMLSVNVPGLGPAGNFARTIARCSGDVIFLSDQDDVWHPEKIARVTERMAEQPGVLVALHDARLVDTDGQPLGHTMAGQIAASGADPARGLVAGCCMAFDGRLGRLFDPAPATPFHDAWLTALADRLGVRGFLPEPLIDYRRHGANVSQSFMSAARRAAPWRRWRERLSRAIARSPVEALAEAVASQESAISAIRQHGDMLCSMLPRERVAAALAGMEADCARDRRRLAIHQAPRRTRPGAILRGLHGGDYRGSQGLLSLLRDVAGVLG